MSREFDFDQVIDRRDWYSLKWDKYANRDVLPFWVADMDFATPHFIIEAIKQRLTHPILGYSGVPDELTPAFVECMSRRLGWEIDPDWVVWTTSVMDGIHVAIQSIGNPGDQCLIPIPVYHPFLRVPENTNRAWVPSQLIFEQDQWRMNESELRNQSRNTTTLLFCNPQNPTGRAYTETELRNLAEICIENNTVLISDEIHWGLVLEENLNHIPVARLSPEIAENTITLISHTKSYNVAGISCAVAVIPNAQLRKDFIQCSERLLPSISPLALAAAVAAFEDQGSWLMELSAYLRRNRNTLHSRLSLYPTVTAHQVESTHLLWIDVRKLGVHNPGEFFEQHGIGLSDGADFGAEGFLRLNFAVPQSILNQGIARMCEAIEAVSDV